MTDELMNTMMSKEALQKIKNDYITEMISSFISFTILYKFKEITDDKQRN